MRVVLSVTDRFGNPLSGVTVRVKPSAGKIAGGGVSDAAGKVTLSWTTGAIAAKQQLTASVGGTKVMANHSVVVGNPKPKAS